ncbi:MAG TPA: filamentous hemagglutinin N-terminal domain-containing protein, partial [Mycobacterium sp.]|uniref:beta strand repeat-containing protein n=1 Tax=Mycobacterium sp. TaxID=1785 RepID=UPI002BA1DA2B
MAGSRSRDGTARRIRGGLLATTALTAAILMRAEPARAQPAQNARPQGGQVVAGSASISTTPSSTTIDQSTQRAAINWNSFNVGSQQTVTFEQPSTSSMTLNRVTGPDPSAIAGHIDANGGIVITNPDGVVFYHGAEVNATNLVVSAPGITNRNFMAGRMVFDQPAKPGAAVVNRGNLTIRQAGLGALVAPEVRNRGTITARLGHVALAGADAATLDMYGDGLVSIDVTRQVARAPDGHEALVTNTGVIEANGGTVQLTAAAADNVVTTLVDARGRIGANSIGNHLGTVAIAGTGGALLVDGRVLAGGVQGGAIEIAGPGDVSVGPRARISASGANGGGTVAIGTDLARASGGASVTPTEIARRVTVLRGARISADARRRGNGGRVTLLTTDATVQNGHVTARGGTLSGNGGLVEISSHGEVGLGGSVDVSASHGSLGSILLDPGTLDIVSGTTASGDPFVASGTLFGNTPDTTGFLTVSNTAVDGLNGNVVLQATTFLVVNAPITLSNVGQGLTLQSAGNLTTNAPIQTNGNIDLEANSSNVVGGTPSGGGTVQLNASVTTTGGSVNLTGAFAEIGSFVFPGTIVAPITASGAITVTAPSYTQWNGSSLHAVGDVSISASTFLALYGPIDSTGGSVNLNGGNVQLGYPGANPPPAPITASNTIGVTAGTFGITQLSVSPLQAGSNISLFSTGVVQLGAPITSTGGAVSITGLNVVDPSPITAATSIDLTATGPDGASEGPAIDTFFQGSLTAGGAIQINAGTATASLNSPIASSGGPVSITGATVDIFAPVTLTGPGQPLTILSSGELITSDSITTQGNIDLVANSAAAGTPSGVGALTLGGAVTTTNGSVTLGGASVTLGTVIFTDFGPVTVASPVSASGTISVNAGSFGVNQLLGSTLQASGNVSIITPGSVTTNDLIASTGGGVTISGSTIGDGGVISANGNISLAGSGGVTIGPAVTSAAGNISITSSGFVDIMD